MNIDDFIISEKDALNRIKSRKPMSVRAWLNVSPYIVKKIANSGWTSKEAEIHLNRPKTTLVNFRKIAEWPRSVISKITNSEDLFSVKDLLWLAERKKTDLELLELVDLHIKGTVKIPSRKIPRYSVAKKKGIITSSDEDYLSSIIRSKTKVEIDKIIIDVEDISLMKEVLKRLWG